MHRMNDTVAARLMGNEHSQLYVGQGPVLTDEEFSSKRHAVPPGYPVRRFELAGGYKALLAVPTLQPVSHGYAEVLREGEDVPVASIDLAILSPAHDAQVWNAMHELQHDDEAFFLFLLFMHCMAETFKELGAATLIWGIRFRPSCGLTGPEQARVFQSFMDGLRAERGVGISVMRQDNHSAPLLLMNLGATMRFGGTFYTPLTKGELEKAGVPGKTLIGHCCWRAPAQDNAPAAAPPAADTATSIVAPAREMDHT